MIANCTEFSCLYLVFMFLDRVWIDIQETRRFRVSYSELLCDLLSITRGRVATTLSKREVEVQMNLARAVDYSSQLWYCITTTRKLLSRMHRRRINFTRHG